MEQNIFEHVAAHRAQVARNVANIFGQEGPTIDNIEKSLDCISAIEMDQNAQANFGNSDFRDPNSPLYNMVRDVSNGTAAVDPDIEEMGDMEKGGKRATIGEIRTYKNGRKYQKTNNGWIEVREKREDSNSKESEKRDKRPIEQKLKEDTGWSDDRIAQAKKDNEKKHPGANKESMRERITSDHITGFVKKLKNGNYDSNSIQGKFIEDLSEQDGIDGWEILQQKLALDGKTIRYNNNEDRYEVKGGVGVDDRNGDKKSVGEKTKKEVETSKKSESSDSNNKRGFTSITELMKDKSFQAAVKRMHAIPDTDENQDRFSDMRDDIISKFVEQAHENIDYDEAKDIIEDAINSQLEELDKD